MKKKIFLDLDDVLFDCTTHVLAYRGFENPYDRSENRGVRQIHKLLGVSWYDVWGGLPAEFWENMPVLPWAYGLVDQCLDLVDGNIGFLTSPIREPACFAGKFSAIHKNWPSLSSKLAIAYEKAALLDAESILIDDSQFNKVAFKDEEKQDNFILFPALSNEMHELRSIYNASPKFAVDDTIVKIKEWLA